MHQDHTAKSFAHFSRNNSSSNSIKENASFSSLYQPSSNPPNFYPDFLNSQQIFLPSQQSQVSSRKKASINNENVKVAVRVRPPLPRELQEDKPFLSTVEVSPDYSSIVICDFLKAEHLPQDKIEEFIADPNNYPKYVFAFDHIYDQDSSQQDVYEMTAKHSVLSVLEGFNSTIFAYGQTGTGKTYTMEGFALKLDDPQIGIIPRAMADIFEFIGNCQNDQANFMVRCSYLQIYNEVVTDLLRNNKTPLQIREDKKKGIYVEDLSEWAVRSPKEVFQLLNKGKQSRVTAVTKLNDTSSRSHAVFIVYVEQVLMDIEKDNAPSSVKTGKLNLVDLAGSERVSVTGATGQRLEESKKINQSLAALGNVIAALTETSGPRTHIPYRDSKITRLLEDSLGGNCKTTMIAMISPCTSAFNHSLSTLKFSDRAKSIENCPEVNSGDEDAKALLVQYEHELKRLKSQLENKRKSIFDINNLLKLQMKVTHAETEKEEALAICEQKMRELQREKEEKKVLEEKIKAISSQVLVGGRSEEDAQYIRTLEEKQREIRSEYEEKINQLEKEREAKDQGLLEAAEYKALLLKQRDVMVGLSQRLYERDNRIVELEADLELLEDLESDAQQKVRQLEQLLKSKSIEIPIYNSVIGESDDQVSMENRVTFSVTEKNLENLLHQDERQFIRNKSYKQVQDLKKKIEDFLNKKRKINDEELKELKDIQALRQIYEQRLQHLDSKFKTKIETLQAQNLKYSATCDRLSNQLSNKDFKLKMLQDITSNNKCMSRDVYKQIKSLIQSIKGKVSSIVDVFCNQKDSQSIKQASQELVQLQMLAIKAGDLINTETEQTLAMNELKLNRTSPLSMPNQNQSNRSSQLESDQILQSQEFITISTESVNQQQQEIQQQQQHQESKYHYNSPSSRQHISKDPSKLSQNGQDIIINNNNNNNNHSHKQNIEKNKQKEIKQHE